MIWGGEVNSMSYAKNKARRMIGTTPEAHREGKCNNSSSAPSAAAESSAITIVSRSHLLLLHFNSKAGQTLA